MSTVGLFRLKESLVTSNIWPVTRVDTAFLVDFLVLLLMPLFISRGVVWYLPFLLGNVFYVSIESYFTTTTLPQWLRHIVVPSKILWVSFEFSRHESSQIIRSIHGFFISLLVMFHFFSFPLLSWSYILQHFRRQCHLDRPFDGSPYSVMQYVSKLGWYVNAWQLGRCKWQLIEYQFKNFLWTSWATPWLAPGQSVGPTSAAEGKLVALQEWINIFARRPLFLGRGVQASTLVHQRGALCAWRWAIYMKARRRCQFFPSLWTFVFRHQLVKREEAANSKYRNRSVRGKYMSVWLPSTMRFSLFGLPSVLSTMGETVRLGGRVWVWHNIETSGTSSSPVLLPRCPWRWRNCPGTLAHPHCGIFFPSFFALNRGLFTMVQLVLHIRIRRWIAMAFLFSSFGRLVFLERSMISNSSEIIRGWSFDPFASLVAYLPSPRIYMV